MQSAEESVFAERRYSASVMNVNGPRSARANKEECSAAKIKESFRLSLAPPSALLVREERRRVSDETSRACVSAGG